MSYLDPIYEVWPTAEAMAADIGENGVTVRQWRRRNSIPPKYWQRIIDAAKSKKAKLNLQQFMPPEQDAAA